MSKRIDGLEALVRTSSAATATAIAAAAAATAAGNTTRGSAGASSLAGQRLEGGAGGGSGSGGSGGGGSGGGSSVGGSGSGGAESRVPRKAKDGAAAAAEAGDEGGLMLCPVGQGRFTFILTSISYCRGKCNFRGER